MLLMLLRINKVKSLTFIFTFLNPRFIFEINLNMLIFLDKYHRIGTIGYSST